MPARPLQCKFCQGVFLPVSEMVWTTVQCPHCSAQMKVSACEPAIPQLAPEGQEYYLVTEQEESAKRSERKHNDWTGRLVILACAAPILGLLAFGVSRWLGKAKHVQEQIGRMPSKSDDADRGEVQGLTQAFLGADNWRAVVSLVAEESRVRTTMEWYYRHRPWQRAAGEVKIAGTARMNAEGREMLRVQASTLQRAVIWLLLVKEGGAWKVDWEFFADAAAVRWESFVGEAAGTVVELPLLVARKPAPEVLMLKAGVAPESHDAVILWARDRQLPAMAVLPKESPDWRDLEGIDFEKPVRVIARVAMIMPDFEPPLVELQAIVQKGWLRAAQMPVAGDTPKQ